MTADLKSGNIDAAWGIPRGAVQARSARSPGLSTVAYNFFNWDYLDLNCYQGKSPRATRCSRTGASATP